MNYIFLFSTLLLFTLPVNLSQADQEIVILSDSMPECSPELDFCRQVTSSALLEQIVVDTIDAGSGTKMAVQISASVDGSVNVANPGAGIDSSVEVQIHVQGQGLCASDKSIRLGAWNKNELRASATCLAVIEGVKTVTIKRIVGGGMVETVLTNPDNTKLRYSWAKLRKVGKIN